MTFDLKDVMQTCKKVDEHEIHKATKKELNKFIRIV